MKHKILTWAALILLAFLFFFLSCCDDCPSGPGEPPQPGNYRVYIWDGLNNAIMSIDSPADTLIDSIHIDFSGGAIYVTPDGERLLAPNWESQTTEIFSAFDLSHIGTLNLYGDFYFGNSNDFAIFNDWNDKIYFIDPISFNRLDSIPRPINYGYIDTLNNIFWGTKHEADSAGTATGWNTIYRIDCENRHLIDSFVLYFPNTSTPIGIESPIYNWKSREVCFCGGYGYQSFLYYFSPESDSIIRMMPITKGFHNLAISPDGNTLYLSDGGIPILDVLCSGNIWIIDAISGRLTGYVPSILFPEGEILWPFRGTIIPTPEGRRLYVAGGPQGGIGPTVVVDLATRTIIKSFELCPNPDQEMIAIGPVPNNTIERILK